MNSRKHDTSCGYDCCFGDTDFGIRVVDMRQGFKNQGVDYYGFDE
ncbi:MAG: hypothetical protein WCS30_08415 [Selenomonadaceae bacterium]